MAIVKEIANRTYSINSKYERNYTRTWHVTYDSSPDQPAHDPVDEVGISINDIYNTCYLTKIDCDQAQAEDGYLFVVTASYGPYEAASPLEEPTSYDWKFSPRTVVLEKDVDGNPVLNSAGLPFEDPFEVDRSRAVLTVTRNELAFDHVLANAYYNSINATPFYGAPVGCVKLANISSQRTVDPSVIQGFYWTTTYEFEFNIEGFDTLILDKGLHKLVDGKLQNILIQGVPVTEPQLLDGEGGVLSVGGVPVFKTFKGYPRLPFTIFDF